MTSEHLVAAAGLRSHPRLVIGRTEILARAAIRPEQLARIERHNLARPIGESTREIYYPREALAQVERVQTLIAAGYAERDVAHVVGKVATPAGARNDQVDQVVELDRAASSALGESGLIPIWAVTEAGVTLIHALDVPLCEALMAMPALGLAELVPALSSAAAKAEPGELAELRRTIEARLDTLDLASALLRKHLTRLAPSRPNKMRVFRRLLRRRK